MARKKREGNSRGNTRGNTGGNRNIKDFSNRAVLLLLLLLILVSVISVIVYVQVLNGIQPKFIVNEGKASGEVAITILSPPDAAASTGGEVGITIVKPPAASE